MTAALLHAAAELFAARGAAAVSVRDIAAHAGVNHGLVHRHFGSKEGLRRAVLAQLTARIAAASRDTPIRLGVLPAAFEATQSLDTYWRMLARALLDGDDIDDLQGDFPVMRQLLAQITEAREHGLLREGADPQVLTAMSAALGLGWLLFEPFVLAATGLSACDDPESVRARVFDTWMSIMSGAA